MRFCWLVLSMEPGKSRIHGEVHGVKKDLSDLLQVTLVEFAKKQVCILTDSIDLDLSQFLQNKFILYLKVYYLLSQFINKLKYEIEFINNI